jgi:4-carboxymuconolactone decarboxylase
VSASSPRDVASPAPREAPRIPPLPESEWDEDVRSLLDGRAINIFTTLVRHRGLYRRWLPFAGKLLARGRLAPRDRELLILRTACNCRAGYEWGQHVLIARQVGIADEEIRRVREGPDAQGRSDQDRVLLRAADELHERSEISERTWEALAQRFDEERLIELCMLVGHYHLVAFALNSLRVQREEGVPGLEEP